MKKLWLGILATLLVVVFVAPSFAWEFSMTGDFEFRYRYFGRADGSKDLFGDMNFQNSPINNLDPGAFGNTGPIGFAGPNFVRGVWSDSYRNNANIPTSRPMLTGAWGDQIKIVRGGFSQCDSDAYVNDQRMTFVPSLKINNAVRLHGTMDLASTRQRYNHRDYQTNGPLDRWYQDRMSLNATDTAMIPSISQWRMTAQMPWGVLSIGAKDFPFGTGSLLGYNTRASAFLLVVPYGPFRFLPSIWLARNPEAFTPFSPYQQNWVTGTPWEGQGDYLSPGSPAEVANYDGGRHHQIQWSVVGTYDNGPLSLGGGFIQQITHASSGNSSPVAYRVTYNGANDAGQSWAIGGSDNNVLLWNMWMKYNNGRFFANAEYNFIVSNTTFLRPTAAPPAGWAFDNLGAPEVDVEASQAFAEAGALCGPAKIAGLFAWSGGPVLNNYNATKVYNGLAINNQATDAYNYLLFHTYGGGNDAPWASGVSFTKEEYGMMADAYALAARLDYAAAANLNLWGSYMWAHRVEQNGFLAGSKASTGRAPTDGTGPNPNALARPGDYRALNAQTWKATAMPGAGAAANMNPYVDDGYLGWEANLGVDWKLLENFSVKSRYAYWQPGPWFDQAYRVVGQLPNNGAASPNAFMQGRSAIQAFESSLVVDF